MKNSTNHSPYTQSLPTERLPEWIKKPIGNASKIEKVQTLVKGLKIHTICEEGRCPNRGECYASGTATFLLGGSICTRSCAFCQVDKGQEPQEISQNEAINVAKAVKLLNLDYVVITSVARDDLNDHGAELFTNTIQAIRRERPSTSIEVLTPDFWGGFKDEAKKIIAQKNRLATVLKSRPVCFNHNIETVRRLQRIVRRGAKYENSLRLLKTAKEISPNIPTKSGLMLGLGEKKKEIIQTLIDLYIVGCERITIGQYLRPSLKHIPVDRYLKPEEFIEIAQIAKEIGFKKVTSGPLVRSSYHAKGG